MSRLRRHRWLVAALVLAGAAGLWAVQATSGDPDVRWVEVEQDDLVLGVEVNGALRSEETSILGPPQTTLMWEFKIAHMHPEGEEVKAGQPVLAFDAQDLRNRLNRQQAEAAEARKKIEKLEKNLELSKKGDELRLAEAEADLRRARLVVERPAELSRAQDLAEARLDLELAEKKAAYLRERLADSQSSARAQLGALEAQEQRALGEVADIEQAIESMVRKAPRDGTVIYVTGWNDEKKKVGDRCWRGERVIELPDLTTMMAQGQVAESDAGQLEVGQQVELRLDAHPDAAFTGKIRSIWKSVQRESWNSPQKVARLEIELDETDTRRMRPGMRFRGQVVTETVPEAPLIPLEAVFVTPEGPVAWRETLLGHERVEIELGRRDEHRAEVLAGLAVGDRVSLTDFGEAGR